MQNTTFLSIWKRYEPFIEALVELFNPFMEAAVHNLESGKIVALYHNFSRRNVGDPSPLKELNVKTENFPDFFTPYYKKNWDGRSLKCTSITLRNEKGNPIGLICFNIDTSVFHQAHQVLTTFLTVKHEAKNPVEIYGSSCEELTRTTVEQYLQEYHLSLPYVSRSQKKEIVQHLYRKGLFNFKNATPFISQYLEISRATVYNYIKNI